MIPNFLTIRRSILMALTMLSSLNLPANADLAQAPEAPTGYFYTDALLISYKPGHEIETYESYGSGGSGVGSTLGLSVGVKNRNFQVLEVGESKAQKYMVSVKIIPAKEDSQTRAQQFSYDLSDLTPRSVEIARDDDGRIYKLNLIPKIVPIPKPRQFKVADFEMENWNFKDSPVILNDQDYIGELGMTGGPLVWCDIPGLANIEFSLLHLKDSYPIGVLCDGILNITHESGVKLQFSNITNGTIDEHVLGGGPYQVWVRWHKPSQSKEEYRALLKQQIAMLQAKIKSGDLTLPPGTMDRLEKMAGSDRVGFVSSGVRGVRSDELVEQPK